MLNAFDALNLRVSTLTSGWQGADKDAFLQEWQKFQKATTDLTQQVDAVAEKIDQYADELAAAQHKYNDRLAVAGIIAAVGIAGTVITFGASDEGAAAGVAAAVGSAVAAAEDAIATAVSALGVISDVLPGIVARLTVLFGANLAVQGAAGSIAYPDHNPFDHLNYVSALESAGAMFVFGGTTGLLGKLGPTEGVSGFTLAVGGVGLTSAALDAATQELENGRVNPVEVLFAGATAGATEGAGLGFGWLAGRLSPEELDALSLIQRDPRKLQAWTNYLNKKESIGAEPWTPERWNAQDDTLRANYPAGMAYRDKIADEMHIVDGQAGWTKEYSPPELGGARRLDIANPDAAGGPEGIETKAGSTANTEALKELQYDKILVNRYGWKITWVLEGRQAPALMKELESFARENPNFSVKIKP